MTSKMRKQTVGRMIWLLVILNLVTSTVSAVALDHLEKSQLIDVAYEARADDDKSIELNQNQTEAESEISQEEEKTKTPRLLSTSTGEPLGMDSLTIVWYLTTFTCLLGFFVVMACTEKSCHRSRALKPQENGSCPPTPCPSYKNFAPPSYESVMEKFNNQQIFIVPVHDNSFINQSMSTDSSFENSLHSTTISTRADVEKGEVISV